VELLDLYPTLTDLAGLRAPSTLEGQSLAPLLRNPDAPRTRPALTTHGPGNHAVRDIRYRYIRYADGSEEFYDLDADPSEWMNRAADPAVAAEKRRLAAFLPRQDARPIAGSRTRLIDYVNGVPIWEGAPIGPDDAVPGP
jgi:arylsulfatase A-like enzyme